MKSFDPHMCYFIRKLVMGVISSHENSKIAKKKMHLFKAKIGNYYIYLLKTVSMIL